MAFPFDRTLHLSVAASVKVLKGCGWWNGFDVHAGVRVRVCVLFKPMCLAHSRASLAGVKKTESLIFFFFVEFFERCLRACESYAIRRVHRVKW